MLCRGELVAGQRLSQSRMDRQLTYSAMPVVEAMRRLKSEGLLLKQARKQAVVDHDADSAEYLMKRHIQSGYAEVQRITLLRHPSLARRGEKGGWGMRHDAIEEQEGL